MAVIIVGFLSTLKISVVGKLKACYFMTSNMSASLSTAVCLCLMSSRLSSNDSKVLNGFLSFFFGDDYPLSLC